MFMSLFPLLFSCSNSVASVVHVEFSISFHNHHMVQVKIPIVPSAARRPRLTRSLLSGSEKSMSTWCESTDASCDTAPISKPFMLRSATDVVSAAIDFSKQNVDDGVVDSPPSKGSYRTPACSPSPLKRTFSTSEDSFWLSQPLDATSSRKLDLRSAETNHRRLDDNIFDRLVHPCSSILEKQPSLECLGIEGLKSAVQSFKLKKSRPQPTMSNRGRRLHPCGESLHTIRFLRNI